MADFGNKSLKKMADDAANSRFALQVNRLFAPVALAALLGICTWGFTTLQSVRDGQAHMQAQQDFDSRRLTNIEDLIVAKTAVRDAQFNAINVKIDDNQQKDEDQFALVNGKINTLANDIAIMRCQLKKC